ncbi:hypothetical protein F5B20DRAFT_583711 [Whalleya microplaca]|nr:hypothetical protein F5B20DRAFT_583711 [Whalleya microplaca]
MFNDGGWFLTTISLIIVAYLAGFRQLLLGARFVLDSGIFPPNLDSRQCAPVTRPSKCFINA